MKEALAALQIRRENRLRKEVSYHQSRFETDIPLTQHGLTARGNKHCAYTPLLQPSATALRNAENDRKSELSTLCS